MTQIVLTRGDKITAELLYAAANRIAARLKIYVETLEHGDSIKNDAINRALERMMSAQIKEILRERYVSIAPVIKDDDENNGATVGQEAEIE
jgi:hypothetical protein